MSDAPGMLYIVSTPIGNLGDISGRAIETLKQVQVVLAEDTRHSRPLLQRFEIATPLLSDPGARLVAAAIEAGVRVVPIPGASALLSALVASGISAHRFTFFGFLERKGAERASAMAEIASLAHTAVLYEAAPRVAHTLRDLSEAGCGERLGSVARELTKQFEEVRRGTLHELAAYYEESPPRGEVVLVIEGARSAEPDEGAARDRARALRAAGISARDVARALVADQGIARNVAYRLAQEED